MKMPEQDGCQFYEFDNMQVNSSEQTPTISCHFQSNIPNKEAHLPLKRLLQHHNILMPERLQHPYLSIRRFLNHLILIR